MRQRALILAFILTASLAGGCGRDQPETLEGFTKRWYAAVNGRRPSELFAMLDSASQRRLRHQLEIMRGLPEAHQREAVGALGGERIKSLAELSPEAYFARLWDMALGGKRPTMTIEARGIDTAYMLLSLDGKRERVKLLVEGGRWAWVLPVK